MINEPQGNVSIVAFRDLKRGTRNTKMHQQSKALA